MFLLAKILLLVLPFGNSKLTNRIVNGTDTSIEHYPYQVSLRYPFSNEDSFHFCGGSIIREKWILTAAHCGPLLKVNTTTVVVGSTFLSSGGFVYNVSKVICHPSYVERNLTNDICLVKVSKKIVFGTTVQAVNISSTKPPIGTYLNVTGWGDLFYDGNLSNTLQLIQLQTIGNAKCKKKVFEFPVTENNICVETITPNITGGSCQGDSGGPAVDPRGVQVGIVSWGEGEQCGGFWPDVFTATANYVPWIKSTIALNK